MGELKTGPICGLGFSNLFPSVVQKQTAQDFPQEDQVCSRGVPGSTGFQEHPESCVPAAPRPAPDLCTSSSDMLKLAQQDAK